jgi:hypothetical protein
MKILDIPKSGKCGRVVAFQSRYGLCLREWVVPRNTITEVRQRRRAEFGSNSRMWSGRLTQEQRDRWCAAGGQVMSHPRLGQRGPLTGQQFWQSISNVRSVVGLPPAFEPPAPVIFPPHPVGRLRIENGPEGVRLWLAVSGELETDIMVFGQEPCPAGRYKRRNVCYLGRLPVPVGGWSEITGLYKAKYGEPRAGRKVFIVTCQTQEGWEGPEREGSAIVPERAEDFQATTEPQSSQKRYMYNGCTSGIQGAGMLEGGPVAAGMEPGEGGEMAAGAGIPDDGGGGAADGPPGRTPS